MKKTLFLAPIFLLVLGACSSLKTSPDTVSKVSEKVNARDYVISVHMANPMRMNPVYLTSEYDLKIKGDSAFGYLPYFGVAHIAPVNPSEGGIRFSRPMMDYSAEQNVTKGLWNIRFRVAEGQLLYSVFIQLYDNGKATVDVNSYDKDMIRFDGELKL